MTLRRAMKKLTSLLASAGVFRLPGAAQRTGISFKCCVGTVLTFEPT